MSTWNSLVFGALRCHHIHFIWHLLMHMTGRLVLQATTSWQWSLSWFCFGIKPLLLAMVMLSKCVKKKLFNISKLLDAELKSEDYFQIYNTILNSYEGIFFIFNFLILYIFLLWFLFIALDKNLLRYSKDHHPPAVKVWVKVIDPNIFMVDCWQRNKQRQTDKTDKYI